jgi:hypothetical protein
MTTFLQASVGLLQPELRLGHQRLDATEIGLVDLPFGQALPGELPQRDHRVAVLPEHASQRLTMEARVARSEGHVAAGGEDLGDARRSVIIGGPQERESLAREVDALESEVLELLGARAPDAGQASGAGGLLAGAARARGVGSGAAAAGEEEERGKEQKNG